jgi:hypothetical protein
MTRFEFFWWWLTGRVPVRFGKLVKIGKWYDSYHNSDTNQSWAFEKDTGTFLERK